MPLIIKAKIQRRRKWSTIPISGLFSRFAVAPCHLQRDECASNRPRGPTEQRRAELNDVGNFGEVCRNIKQRLGNSEQRSRTGCSSRDQKNDPAASVGRWGWTVCRRLCCCFLLICGYISVEYSNYYLKVTSAEQSVRRVLVLKKQYGQRVTGTQAFPGEIMAFSVEV